MTRLRIRKQSVLTLLLLLAAVVSAVEKAVASGEPIKIEYLHPTYLNISAQGINRLHFEGSRIVKIIGDSSQYSAIIPGDGADLFLVSKIPAPGSIKLTLLAASNEPIDLVLNVTDQKEATIININPNCAGPLHSLEHREIKAMIDKMVAGLKGKYFVEEKKQAVLLPNRPDLSVSQYVTYRFKDYVGVGFNYVSAAGKRKKKAKILERLEAHEVASNFQNAAAVAVVENGPGEGRLFIVVRRGEGSDV